MAKEGQAVVEKATATVLEALVAGAEVGEVVAAAAAIVNVLTSVRLSFRRNPQYAGPLRSVVTQAPEFPGRHTRSVVK
jgi:hypothetical protein